MRQITFLLLNLLVSTWLLAEKSFESIPEFYIQSIVKNEALSAKEAKIEFIFKTHDGAIIKKRVIIGMNEEEYRVIPDSNGLFSNVYAAGYYLFQFYYNKNYFEITTDTLKIKRGYTTRLVVNFSSSQFPVKVYKPVVYMYSQEQQKFNLQIHPKGKFTFTYPTYNNKWSGTANPDGTITIDESDYSYLFWEAALDLNVKDLDAKYNFIISKNNLLDFMEESLNKMGFTSSEKQDFITYWYPQMMGYDSVFVNFMFTESFNEYAPMEISPKPDNLFRLYMVWQGNPFVNIESSNVPEFPQISRNGFSVIEWGGSKINFLNQNTAYIK